MPEKLRREKCRLEEFDKEMRRKYEIPRLADSDGGFRSGTLGNAILV